MAVIGGMYDSWQFSVKAFAEGLKRAEEAMAAFSVAAFGLPPRLIRTDSPGGFASQEIMDQALRDWLGISPRK